MAQNQTIPAGYIPTGTGPKGAAFGRDPVTQRAFKRDGTVRAERRSFDADEQVARIEAERDKAMRTVGTKVLKACPSLSTFRATVGTFQKWVRNAAAYGTPEAVADRRAYFQRMLDTVDAKHAAAVRWLPSATKAKEAVAGLFSQVGAAFAAFRSQHKRAPNAQEQDVIVSGILTPEVRSIVESAADPAKDPFAAFHRDAPEADTGDDASDVLGTDDEDADEDNG